MKLQNIETKGNEVRVKLDHVYIMTLEEVERQIRTTTQWLQVLFKAKRALENENQIT